MIAFLFPGQGAQFSGMGAKLIDSFPSEVSMADGVLQESIAALCQAEDTYLRRTDNTQPALFFVNALYAQELERMGIRPSLAAGHSLGELNALVSAGVMSLKDGLKVALARGRAMAYAAEKRAFHGGMVAIGSVTDPESLRGLLDEEYSDCDLAADNSPTQLAVSGPADRVKGLARRVDERGLGRATVLNVGGAFHSRYMRDASNAYREWLFSGEIDVNAPSIPVFSNVPAEPYTSDRTEVTELMEQQLTSPVRWRDEVHAMARQGPVLFQELGPRSIVTSLASEVLQAMHRDEVVGRQ